MRVLVENRQRILKRHLEELFVFIVRLRVIDRAAVVTLAADAFVVVERNIVWRILENGLCFLTAHQFIEHVRIGAIAADNAVRAELVQFAQLGFRLFDFLQLLLDIKLIVLDLEIIEDVCHIGVVEAAYKERIDVEVVRECLPVPIAMDAVASKEILVVFLLCQLAVWHAHGNALVLASQELEHHETLVTGDHGVVGIDDRQFDEVKLFE